MTPPRPATDAHDHAAAAPMPGGGLLFDYNRAAAGYWWLLAVLGALAFGISVEQVARLAPNTIWQIVGGAAIATAVGMFPLRIPKTKTSIAAGDIFIFLLLLLHGPFAAVIAATAEAAACAWRTSTRWSSRIASPTAAALAMLVCGHLFDGLLGWIESARPGSDGLAFAALLLFAGVYFIVSPSLVTTVIYLKRWRAPSFAEWLTTFGWLGMGYLASASIAGVLYLAFNQFGLTTVLVAVPMIGMFVTSLRVYFAQQEASEQAAAERASRERAEHAEREAGMVAQHLSALELSDRRFQSAFAHAAIGMALVSTRGRLVQLNPAMCLMLGHADAAMLGLPLLNFIHDDDGPALERQMLLLRANDVQHFRSELRFRHAQGLEVWASVHGSYFADGASTEAHLIIQAFDVTARRLAESRLQHMAYHDGLTDLANRSRLHEAVAQAMAAHAADPARPFSVLHLSFDRFKMLSDSYGRGVGDQFLIAVARRIQGLVRPREVLARLEGDDFGILALHEGGGTHQAIVLAERLLAAFGAPLLVNGNEVHAGANIGITFSDIGYADADDALRDASLAMAKAKADGKSRYAVFDASLHEQASEQLRIETDLRQALDEEQLALAFQPVFAITPLRLVGFEALARWPHPTRGMVSPAQFIPVAESSGLVVALTRWALRSACRQLRDWQDRFPGAEALFVNVNITGQDLCEAGFADLVHDALAQHELPAQCLTLEITETALMQQLELGRRTIARLREMGVGLSIDDFGTGYSSLSLLSTLPINSLKIDRSFVDRLDGVSAESEIVRAVIQLGHALGKRVIAEGIETEAQLARLGDLGCGYAQGFLLARPLAAAQVDKMLALALADGAAATGSAPVAEAPQGPVEPVAPARRTAAARASGALATN